MGVAAPVVVPVRRRAAYEDWRPPVIGVALLIPVGRDGLAVADLHGTVMLPVGGVRAEQSPEDAAQRVLRLGLEGLPPLRHVVVDRVQTRRRKVTTHVLATPPMTRSAVENLVYRDPRAVIRVMPTLQFLDEAWPKGRPRVLLGLQALATGNTAHIEDGTVLTETVCSCGSAEGALPCRQLLGFATDHDGVGDPVVSRQRGTGTPPPAERGQHTTGR
jgi:hypothetical protein